MKLNTFIEVINRFKNLKNGHGKEREVNLSSYRSHQQVIGKPK